MSEWESENQDSSTLEDLGDSLLVSAGTFEGFVVKVSPPFDGSFKVCAITYGDDATIYARRHGLTSANYPHEIRLYGFFGNNLVLEGKGVSNTGNQATLENVSELEGKWIFQDTLQLREIKKVSGYRHSGESTVLDRQIAQKSKIRESSVLYVDSWAVLLVNERYRPVLKLGG